ncbi:DUF1905 domain-containing protein [Archangium lansingense]|uniref:DUF1905 domain-containing protein n=1 Tax=Archangium lansingense TaxID=2995310 RepID=UPI003B82297E
MRQEKFATVVEAGHMGLVYIQLPFDPSVAWDVRPRQFVQGRLNGSPFVGEVGFRRRKFYILLDEELQRVAGLSPGDAVEVVIEPREPAEAELSSDARLAWIRPAGAAAPRAKKTVRAAMKKKVTRGATSEARPVKTPARKKPGARKRAVKT